MVWPEICPVEQVSSLRRGRKKQLGEEQKEKLKPQFLDTEGRPREFHCLHGLSSVPELFPNNKA